ncbi:DEAD/DEAH box helicase [Alterinioella nitratireducens]|uniref:DEAD/DEAH box helicase n=1 Tax=Alterinioella nitratireducens TaxID=2735915 RepID=UPI000C94C3E7|nr:DEAD/DEAH box helicase [Alterinioella nitratireducens]MAN13894.1 DEAD/DEAH box helicase [Dinoroseobacter sp.]NPD18715.1 DEAD/DEAH box helicase [Alterinioella nitratireducens]
MFDFDMLGLSPTLLTAIKQAGYDQPTPIQNQAIPLALDGHDVMGLAQTGTGKTAAFGLPLAEMLLNDPGRPDPKCVKALILAPTRELVNQIAENLKLYVKGSRLKVGTVVGGQSINNQIRFLARGIDILVATPGRLIDLMDRRAVRLDQAKFLVLDEADQMLDMGFIHALRRIAPELGTPRQTMLFSATMPKQMEELSAAYLTNPRRVQVAPPGKPADKVTQSLHFVPKTEKPVKLRELLNRHPDTLSLVFSRTKHGAEKLMKGLVKDGYNAASIHGNKSQNQRDRAIKGFREGAVKILVATDVAARGIDIPDVRTVYNYDLPEVPDNYVHRIGRTARAGKDGEAIAFCCAEEVGLLNQIEKVMKKDIPVASGRKPEEVKVDKPTRGGGGRRGGRPQGKPAGVGAPSGNRRRRSRKPAA